MNTSPDLNEQCWSLAFYDRFDKAMPRILACGVCVQTCIEAGSKRWPRVDYFQRRRMPPADHTCVACGVGWSVGRRGVQLEMFPSDGGTHGVGRVQDRGAV